MKLVYVFFVLGLLIGAEIVILVLLIRKRPCDHCLPDIEDVEDSG